MMILLTFTNLHLKISLFAQIFSIFFGKMFPNEDAQTLNCLLRIFLHFFQKNQILSPDTFKKKTGSFLDKKNLQKLEKNVEVNKKSLLQNSVILKKYLRPTRRGKNGKRMKKPEETSFENAFSFVRENLWCVADRLLNICEVADALVEKISDYEDNSKSLNIFFRLSKIKILTRFSNL